MKIINQKQFAKLIFFRKRRLNPVNLALEKLKVNQLLLVEPKDWKRDRKALGSTIHSCFTKKKFQVMTLDLKKGWVIRRIK